MVIFIKVKDNVKNKLNNQLAATLIFFQYKTYGGKITYRKEPGGPQCLNFSNFALGRKKKFAIQCVGKNKEFTWESNFSTENLQLRAKNRSGVFADPPPPPVPRGLKGSASLVRVSCAIFLTLERPCV